MIRIKSCIPFLLSAVLVGGPCLAQEGAAGTVAPRHHSKPSKKKLTQRTPAALSSSAAGNLNMPSTDRSDFVPSGTDGADGGDRDSSGQIRPAMNDQGHIGLGTGF